MYLGRRYYLFILQIIFKAILKCQMYYFPNLQNVRSLNAVSRNIERPWQQNCTQIKVVNVYRHCFMHIVQTHDIVGNHLCKHENFSYCCHIHQSLPCGTSLIPQLLSHPSKSSLWHKSNPSAAVSSIKASPVAQV